MTFWAAGAAVVGGVIGASGARSAANTQAGASDRATAAEQASLERQSALQEPFRQSGLAANNRLLTLLGIDLPDSAYQNEDNFNSGRYLELNPDANEYMRTSGNSAYDHWVADGRRRQGDFWNTSPADSRNASRNSPDFGSLTHNFGLADYQEDPGLAFRRQQGELGLTRGAAAAGMLGSGKYLKDAMSYNSGLASQEYGKAFDRFQVNRSNLLNPLQSLMGAGQTSTNALGQAESNFGQQVGSNILGAGNARAAGQVGGANALTGAIGTGWNMYQGNQMMNLLQQRQPGYGDLGGPITTSANPGGFYTP